MNKELVLSGEYFRIKGIPYLKALIRHYENKAKKFNYSDKVMEHCIEEIDLIINHLNRHSLHEMKEIAQDSQNQLIIKASKLPTHAKRWGGL